MACSEWIVTMDHNRLISGFFRRAAQLLAVLGMAGVSAHAAAADFENLDRLDSLVAMTVGANIGEPGGPMAAVDRRLRLKPCPSTPKVEGPVFSAAIVSCAETGWRIRVPLAAAPAADRVPMFAGANTPASRVPMASARPAQAEKVVKKGDPVELIAGSDVFSVSRLMIADEDGAIGDMIRVREDAKAPPVSARVERAGRVRAPTI